MRDTKLLAKKPLNAQPPLCGCGCGGLVNWIPYKGWGSYLKGHGRKGKPCSKTHRERQSMAAKARYKGKRNRDLDPTGTGVYVTWEYREARDRLVKGKPCVKCGTFEKIHAHHRIPGDDDSLIPLCGGCHAFNHHYEGNAGRTPVGEPPLCACGCGRQVGWKQVRGWAKFCKGHGGAKVSGKIRCIEAPLCKCGCGEKTNYVYGVGWHDYVRGHRQRVEGHYKHKPGYVYHSDG